MAEIKVKAVYDGTSVSTGLQRLKGEAERTSEEIGRKLNRRFGAPEVFKGLLQGIGIGSVDQIKDLIVQPWKDAADQAERLAKNAEAASAAQSRVIGAANAGRSDPERMGILQNEIGELSRTIQRESVDVQRDRKYASTNGPKMAFLMKILGETQARAVREDTMQDNEAKLAEKEAEVQTLRRSSAKREEDEHLASLSLADSHAVKTGGMTEVEAAARAAGRAQTVLDAIKADPSRSGELFSAQQNQTRADYDEEYARSAAARRFAEGVNPVISASSLARLGGGGNVNAFGGRETAAERELRTQTSILRSIELALKNTHKNGLNDVSP